CVIILCHHFLLVDLFPREIATTHFEATDARAAFPCFDEPDLKANFTLSMVREHRHISLFNMPLKASVAHGDGLMQDNYETSVKMSTYLVAFVVCDFKNVTSHTNNKQKTMVRVFAPEDQIDQAHYALEVAVKVLDYYNDFFGVPYPLPKQDMIAIPDFSAGAMENWGLITYRMTSILYDPSKTSASGKQWIAVVIAHELAHQWFGNIVTMKWWDDLWLNEGFASFVEYMGAGKAEPSFGMREQFVYQTLQQALYLDSFTNSHPIQVPVNDPAEISAIFDKISYDKGASLIAMVQAFIGEGNFKQGLHDYLTAHAYSNARTADLWDSLQKASSMDSSMTVKDVMDTWTLQMGYPVVTVKRKPGTNQITLSQERFLLSHGSDKTSKYTSPYNYTWKVPFTYRTKSNPKQQLVWLTEKEMTLPTPLSAGDWIKGNMLTGGFYRVNYEPSLWRLIIQDLKTNKDVLSVRDRAGLLDDAFSLARAGLLSYDIALELLAYLAQETEYVPMVTAISSYSFVSARLLVTHVFPKVEKYMLNLISNRLHALNWTNHDQHLAKLLQGSLISRAVSLGDKASIHRAQQLFKAGNWTNIPDNLRATVYNTAVEYGDDETWEQVFRAYTASNVPTEKKQFLYALTQTRDPRRIQLFLRDTLNDKVIRSQDSESMISGIASQDTGHLFAWRFVQQNWDALYKMYGDTSFQLSGLVKAVVAPFNTQFDFHEVSEFFKDKNLGPGKMALQQSLETVNTHITWAAKHQDNITQWFKTHVKDNE
ncbi:glutamyl aminopeptidase-like, partial [Littorina saxatilis]|uniref:glutamyl aminopeptidase-like n=1 Tax=Littorina saxatilis TaxID=31220 RepID=UPI0038B4A548